MISYFYSVRFTHREKAKNGETIFTLVTVDTPVSLSEQESVDKAKSRLTLENAGLVISEEFREISLLVNNSWKVIEVIEKENKTSNNPVSDDMAMCYPFIKLTAIDNTIVAININQIISFGKSRDSNLTTLICRDDRIDEIKETVDEILDKVREIQK